MKNRKQCIPFSLLQFFDHDLIKLFYWTTKVLVPTLGGERKKKPHFYFEWTNAILLFPIVLGELNNEIIQTM